MASIRQNKKILFGGMGFIGGVTGALFGELASPERTSESMLALIASSALWGALIAVGILIGLTWALDIYAGRTRPSGVKLKGAIGSGLVAGAIALGIAQAVYGAHGFSGMGGFFFQSGCWGLAGAILGGRISRAIPNLKSGRAMLAGFIGGGAGGMGFLIISGLLVAVLGRAIGVGILGAALGLAMVIVEELCREASLEVIWAPKETTVLSLGARPISIGGGDDHVYIRGLPHRSATLQLEEGRIQYTDTATGKKTEFRDGSRIKIGKVEMVVHAKK